MQLAALSGMMGMALLQPVAAKQEPEALVTNSPACHQTQDPLPPWTSYSQTHPQAGGCCGGWGVEDKEPGCVPL